MRSRRGCTWEEASELLGERAHHIVRSVFLEARKCRARSNLVAVLRLVAPWAGAWVIVLNSENTVVRVVFTIFGVLAGGMLGSRLVELVPVKVDLGDVFEVSSGSLRFWTDLEPRYRKRRFMRLLAEHGPQHFGPRNQAHLRSVLAKDQSNWGSYPAKLLRSVELREAGLEGWVAQRTTGAVEMADALCEAPGARTLDDLVALIERIGRKPAKTPAA